MSQATDAIYRQWLLLQAIPRAPRTRTTADLHDALAQEGLAVDRRTVQRDLERLATLFPLTTEPDGPGLRWAWLREAAVRDIPAMSPATALTFQLARDHLTDLFPPSLMAVLAPYFDRADAVLGESRFAHWRHRVRLVRPGPGLGVPEVSAPVRDAVYQALLEERQLEAGYYSRSRASHERRRIHPLGLVGRDGVYYLVAGVDDHPDPRQLALHRLDDPVVLDASVQAPPDFELDHYLTEQAAFAYPRSSGELALTLAVTPEVAFHLRERPLAADQTIEAGEDTATVRATVADTEALRWWLLGFGPSVRVVAPEALQVEIGARLHAAAELYPASAG